MVLQEFGLGAHPLVSKVMADGSAPKQRLPDELRRVISCTPYSLDSESKYMRMQGVEQMRPSALRKLKRKADKFTELDSGKSTKLSAASIRAAALLDHLKV